MFAGLKGNVIRKQRRIIIGKVISRDPIIASRSISISPIKWEFE
jgi:hypothetical protein